MNACHAFTYAQSYTVQSPWLCIISLLSRGPVFHCHDPVEAQFVGQPFAIQIHPSGPPSPSLSWPCFTIKSDHMLFWCHHLHLFSVKTLFLIRYLAALHFLDTFYNQDNNGQKY